MIEKCENKFRSYNIIYTLGSLFIIISTITITDDYDDYQL